MKKVVKFFIFILLITGFIYFGTRDYKKSIKKKVDKEKVSNALIGDGYVFSSINHSKLLSLLQSKNADFILYACIDDDKMCVSYGDVINNVAKSFSIEEIYYYDFKTDREEKNATYQKIVDKLSDYLLTNDLGEQDLYSPTLLFIKNGSVFAIDDDLAFNRGKVDAQDVLTEEFKSEKELNLLILMEGYLNYE